MDNNELAIKLWKLLWGKNVYKNSKEEWWWKISLIADSNLFPDLCGQEFDQTLGKFIESEYFGSLFIHDTYVNLNGTAVKYSGYKDLKIKICQLIIKEIEK